MSKFTRSEVNASPSLSGFARVLSLSSPSSVRGHGRSLLKGISFSVRERWTHLTICLGSVYLKDTFRYRVSADTYPSEIRYRHDPVDH